MTLVVAAEAGAAALRSAGGNEAEKLNRTLTALAPDDEQALLAALPVLAALADGADLVF